MDRRRSHLQINVWYSRRVICRIITDNGHCRTELNVLELAQVYQQVDLCKKTSASYGSSVTTLIVHVYDYN
jgi:hypothetical protein